MVHFYTSALNDAARINASFTIGELAYRNALLATYDAVIAKTEAPILLKQLLDYQETSDAIVVVPIAAERLCDLLTLPDSENLRYSVHLVHLVLDNARILTARASSVITREEEVLSINAAASDMMRTLPHPDRIYHEELFGTIPSWIVAEQAYLLGVAYADREFRLVRLDTEGHDPYRINEIRVNDVRFGHEASTLISVERHNKGK